MRPGPVPRRVFAELSNPTSNALYRRLGYRTLADWSVYGFS